MKKTNTGIERRDIPCVLRSINDESRTITYVASDESVDAHDTIVRQNFRLTRYAKNPIVLRDHDSSQPVGHGMNLRQENNAESGLVETLVDVCFGAGTQRLDDTWIEAKQRLIPAMSIGFRPLRTGKALVDGRELLVFEESELYELSVLTQPSNANALARELETPVANEGRSGVHNMPDKTEAPIAPAAIVPVPAPVAEVRSEPAPAPPPAAPVVAAAETVARSVHDASLAALQGTITEQRAALTATEKRAADAEAKLKVLDDERLVRKVDSFVGPKLLPAQRDAWLVLARDSEKGFDALIAMQPDLAVVGAPLIPPAPAGARSTDAGASKMRRLAELTAERRKATGESECDAMAVVMAENPTLCTD